MSAVLPMDEREKDTQRRKLEQDMQAYLKNGGAINRVPTGIGQKLYFKHTTKNRRNGYIVSAEGSVSKGA